MSEALERNLRGLLARHQPVAVDPDFAARLERRVLEEAGRLATARLVAAEAATTPRPRLRRLPRPALAAAALLLVALAAVAWLLREARPVDLVPDGAGLLVAEVPGTGSRETGPPAPAAERDARRVEDLLAGPVAPRPAPAAGVLAGRIVRAEDGTPVRAARLVLASQDVAEGGQAELLDVTDEDGRFRWADPPPGRYALYVQAEGLAVHVTRHVRIGADLVLPELDLRLVPGVTLRGRVRGADGAPLEGALVVSDSDAPAIMLPLRAALLDEPEWRGIRARTLTDAEGRFELHDLSGDAVHVLRVSAPGHAPAWVEYAPGVREAELRLARGGAVAGLAAHADGSPRAGAVVVASFLAASPAARCMAIDATLTDDGGAFRLDDLPALQGVVLLFEGEGEATGLPEMRAMAVRAGEVARVDFGPPAARPASGVLSGTLSEADGSPASGRMLSVVSADADTPSQDWLGSMVDADGGFRIEGLPPGRLEVYVVLDLEGTVTRVAEVELAPSGGAHLDLRLPQGGLHGQVLDPDGRPAARAVVIVQRRLASGEWIFVNRNLADAAGAWRAEALAPGLYRALGFDWQGRSGATLSDPLAVGELSQPLDLVLRAGTSLRVRVEDADGAPLAGALVGVRDPGGREWPLAEHPRTGADGVLELDCVPGGTWEVEARLAGHLTARTPIELRAGEPAELRLRLPRGP